MKRLFHIFLIAVLMITALAGSVPASAGVSWPSFSSNKPIHAFTIKEGNCDVYDASHTKESGRYTEKGDEVYILSISNGWATISYPTPSKRRTAYAPVSTFFCSSGPQEAITARSSETTYRRPNLSQKAGSVDVGDDVRKIGTSGSSVQIVYNIGSSSNPSGYRAAWVSKAAYDRMKGASSSGSSSGRSASAYNKAIDDRNVTVKFKRDGDTTYCNRFVIAVMKAYNTPIPNALANDIYLKLKSGYSGWKSCSATEAQARANKGYPTVVCYYNSGGHGHIAVVRPETSSWKYSSSKGPVIANAGATCFNYGNVTKGFGSNPVKYFTHD